MFKLSGNTKNTALCMIATTRIPALDICAFVCYRLQVDQLTGKMCLQDL